MRFAARRLTGLATLTAAVFLAGAGVASAEPPESRTYRANLQIFCGSFEPDRCCKRRTNATPPVCTSWWTEDEIRTNAEWQFTHVLEAYRPTGLSFALDVNIRYDNEDFARFDGKAESRHGPLNAEGEHEIDPETGKTVVMPIFQGLLDIGSSQPDTVTFIATERWNWAAFSGLSSSAVFVGGPGNTKRGLYAHELGHYFSLWHTQSNRDVGDVPPGEEDDTVWPDDPAERVAMHAGRGSWFEDEAGWQQGCIEPNPGGYEFTTVVDEQWKNDGSDRWDFTTLFPQHFACVPGTYTKDGVVPAAANHPEDPICWERDWVIPSTGPFPFVPGPLVEMGTDPAIFNNIMSYYMYSSGPYVANGTEHPGLTECQAAVVRYVAIDEQENTVRTSLEDVCADRHGDSDLDGKCNDDEVCINHFNPYDETDTDDDGVPDVCDFCASDPEVDLDGDLDGDGFVGLCDLDEDGDGCWDDPASARRAGDPDGFIDNDPETTETIGESTGPRCFPIIFNDANDYDGDGVPGCADEDDLDGMSGCTYFEIPIVYCRWCNILNWWDIRVNVLTPLGETLTFSNVRRFGNRLSIGANVGEAASVTQRSFFGAFSGLAESAAATAPEGGMMAMMDQQQSDARVVRLEFVSAETGEVYDSMYLTNVETDELAQGEYAILELGEAGAPARAFRSYGRAGQPVAQMPDNDGDGVPNLSDNCLDSWNPAQYDSDADGYGNACDHDVTGDNRVNWHDLVHLFSCIGHKVSVPTTPVLVNSGSCGVDPSPRPERAERCDPLDLDGDGRVTFRKDLRVELLPRYGETSGPSGIMVQRLGEPERHSFWSFWR